VKILDERGRLFGKINIIDGAAVILLAAIIAMHLGLIKKTPPVESAF